MRMPEGRALLDLVDAAAGLGTARRAIVLLAACDPDLTLEQAAALDLGRFETRLLDLCEACLGPSLVAQARCPACHTALDIEIATNSLRQSPPAGVPALLSVEHDGVTLSIRLPTGLDLALVEPLGDDAAARAALLRRCVLGMEGIAEPSAAMLDRVSDALGEALPQVDVAIALACAACGHGWQALLDLGTFLWRDLAYRVARLSQDVHVLASAYHWSEDAILALPPARRRRYLDLVQS